MKDDRQEQIRYLFQAARFFGVPAEKAISAIEAGLGATTDEMLAALQLPDSPGQKRGQPDNVIAFRRRG